MILHGHLFVPGINTKADLDALSNPPRSSNGEVTQVQPEAQPAPPQLSLKKLFSVVIYNHGSDPNPDGEPSIAKLYVDQGFAFFAPDRHGQGLSKDAGPY